MIPARIHKAKESDDNRVHQGRNVKSIREMLGWKQEALADRLGKGWSQKRISLMESKEAVQNEVIIEISKILEVPEELLRNATRSMLRQLLQSTRGKLSMEASAGVGNNKSTLEIELHAMSKLTETVNILVDCQRYLANLFDRSGTEINSADFPSNMAENNIQALEGSTTPVQRDHDTEV